jgi:hypothetical protein
MPLREQDRAVWIGPPGQIPIGSSGKVREVKGNLVLVGWGEGFELWSRIGKEVVTCKQAGNKGVEPWAQMDRETRERTARLKAEGKL